MEAMSVKQEAAKNSVFDQKRTLSNPRRRSMEQSFRTDFLPVDGHETITTVENGTHAPQDHAAFDETSGETLTPMSTVGASAMGAPIQAKKKSETRMDKQIAMRMHDQTKPVALSELANHRRMIPMMRKGKILRNDINASYRKALSKLSQKDIEQILAAQDAQASVVNKQYEEQGMGPDQDNMMLDSFAEIAYDMKHNPEMERYRGFEALQKDIAAQKGGSAELLKAALAKRGKDRPQGVQSPTERLEQYRDDTNFSSESVASSMNDLYGDGRLGMGRSLEHNYGPEDVENHWMEQQQSTLGELDKTFATYDRKKIPQKKWWQFWK